jgi:multidrug efflux system membrane fusion protein
MELNKKKILEYLEKTKILEYLEKKKIPEYVKENKRILKLIGVLLLAILMTSHIKSCQREHAKQKVYPRLIQTAVAVKKDVPLHVESFGTLASPKDVDVKAQVTGKVLEVNFVQGSEVSAGDLLVVIDPKEYKADADKAKAAIAEDEADLQLKKDTLTRNKQLYDKQLISDQVYEKYKSDVAAAEAQLQLDQAALELAEINLGYCQVRSPIDGLAGKRQVDLGNIVSANTGPTLVNIKKIDKLYIDFTLPEGDLPKVRKAMQEGTLEVRIIPTGEEDEIKYGELEFIDNAVNESTGTFFLRAKVNNSDRTLWPGQFVKVRLVLGTEKNAVVVPYKAAQIGKNGYYVFTVKGRKAYLRQVTVGDRDDDEIIIEEGVKAGETVVTVGQFGLSPGMPVYDVTKQMEKEEKKK